MVRRGIRLRLRRRPSDVIEEPDTFEVRRPEPLREPQLKVLRSVLSRGANPQARTLIRLAEELQADVEAIRVWFAEHRLQRFEKKSPLESTKYQRTPERLSHDRHESTDVQLLSVQGPPFRVRLRRLSGRIVADESMETTSPVPVPEKSSSGSTSTPSQQSSNASSEASAPATPEPPSIEGKDKRTHNEEDEEMVDMFDNEEGEDDAVDEDEIDEAEEEEDDEEEEEDDEEEEEEQDIEDDEEGEEEEEQDPKRLTARQRSMRKLPEPSPNASQEAIEDDKQQLSEALALKKSELARRRRLMQERLEEEAKQDTIERLLKKTSVRKKRADRKKARKAQEKLPAHIRRQEEMRAEHDTIRYRNFITTSSGGVGEQRATLTFPRGYVLAAELDCPPPPAAAVAAGRAAPTVCAAPGCGKPRRYTCARLHEPLCSLQCYRSLHQGVRSATS